MRLSLRQRIALAFVPILLLIALQGAGGAVLLARLGARSEAILRENYDSVQAMTALGESATTIDSAFRAALAGKEEEARDHFRSGWAQYQQSLDAERGNVTIFPEEPRLFAELDALSKRYRDAGDRFIASPAGDPGRVSDYYGTPDRPGLLQLLRDIKRVATAILRLNEGVMKATSLQTEETARSSIAWLLLGLALAALAALVAGWSLLRAILGPIQEVTVAAQAIGEGQLHLAVPVFGADELGRLARAFNAMTAQLRVYRQTDTQKLLRARQMGQATIDSFPDPVVVLDPLGRVESANPAAQRLLGVHAPAEGQPPLAWQPPESLRQAVDAGLRERRPFLAEGFDQGITFQIDREDRTFLPQVRPICSAAGETLGAAVVLADVTRFRLLDRLKSDWVATVSHELKTPLTSVRLAVHVLLEELVGPLEPKQVELLIEARENTERLFKLIEQLLALARLEDGREPFERQSTDALSLLRTAADAALARAEDKRVSLVVADGSPACRVAVDPMRFGLALGNLLDNAITYTEPGGTVTLSAEPVGPDRVRLRVADTGIGIPPEHLPHVFERFFRVPGRDQSPGTGLGLAIVKEVIEAHGGQISCTSETGVGTAFDILLPAARATP